MQTQLVRNLSRVHRVRQILLVGEDQQERISQLVLVQHALQLLTGLNDTVTVVAVDDEDDTLGVLEVVPPQRSNLVLSANIPNRELDVLVLDRLNVEAWSSPYQLPPHMVYWLHRRRVGITLEFKKCTYQL